MEDYVANMAKKIYKQKEQAVKIAKIEMAEKMIVKGMSLDEVIEITGLRKQDIEGLE